MSRTFNDTAPFSICIFIFFPYQTLISFVFLWIFRWCVHKWSISTIHEQQKTTNIYLCCVIFIVFSTRLRVRCNFISMIFFPLIVHTAFICYGSDGNRNIMLDSNCLSHSELFGFFLRWALFLKFHLWSFNGSLPPSLPPVLCIQLNRMEQCWSENIRDIILCKKKHGF